MKVLCLWYATKEELNDIRKALPKDTVVAAPEGKYFSRFESTFAALKDHAADADVIIGWSIPKGLLESAKKLKLLCWQHSGCDDLDMKLLRERGVKVANIRGANATAVAEHAMMFVLALAKQTIKKHKIAQEGMRTFPVYGDEYRAGMLEKRTIGIIGVGSIGSLVAKYAKGFDMRVLGVRRDKSTPDKNVDVMYGMNELHTVLGQSDYVVLATPITPETFQYFGEAEFNAMKPTAFLINIARGNLVQELPLYEALTSNRIKGFAADVWQRYEFGRAFPIGYMPRLAVHQMDNVTASIDQAANADDVLERDLEWGIQSLAEFAAGKPLTREVDLELGY